MLSKRTQTMVDKSIALHRDFDSSVLLVTMSSSGYLRMTSLGKFEGFERYVPKGLEKDVKNQLGNILTSYAKQKGDRRICLVPLDDEEETSSSSDDDGDETGESSEEE